MRETDDRAISDITVDGISARAFLVPLRYALGTSAARVTHAPIVTLDLLTREGVIGHAYSFAYRRSGARAIVALAEEAAELVRGQPLAPQALAARLMRAFALLGVTGTARMALSLIDMAAWDALARGARLPLCRLLGAQPCPVRAYNSSGLGLMEPAALAEEAEALIAGGFGAVKLRLGHADWADDRAAIRAVRNRLADDIAIFTDYNQALSVQEALARGRALLDEGATWLEEPIRHDDIAGNARIAASVPIPLQIGENFNGPADLAAALQAGACDLVMPDVARIGGVSGWIAAASLAAAHDVEMSSHLMPEISAQLLCATPTAHWLEYVDWADAFLAEPLTILDGHAVVPDTPGSGLSWDEERIAALEAI